jgi:hypothetical protein
LVYGKPATGDVKEKIQEFGLFVGIKRLVNEHLPQSAIEVAAWPRPSCLAIRFDPLEKELRLAIGYCAVSKNTATETDELIDSPI